MQYLMVTAGQQKLAIFFFNLKSFPHPPPQKKTLKFYLKTEFYQRLQITMAIFPVPYY